MKRIKDRSGRIFTPNKGSDIRKAGGYRKYYEMKMKEVREHFSETVKVGRNDKCPCGSEKKYKKCCLNK